MSEMEPVVHVIDDDAAFLTATHRLLRASGFAVKAFSSGKGFLDQLASEACGCIVSDLQMPEMTGLELQAELSRRKVTMPIVFLSGHGDITSAVRAMHEGAEDFLEKLAPREKLIASVTRALARNASERQEQTRLLGLRKRFEVLTDRESEVLRHVVRGSLNRQIAAELGISERTVKAHRSAITTKLGVPSAAELTRLTLEAGLFPTAS